MVIEYLKNKLYESIEKYGLNSKETYNINIKLDEEIIKYYKEQNSMTYCYKKSIEELKRITKKDNKPIYKKNWNKIAKDKQLLSSESIQYMSNLKFEKICYKLRNVEEMM